MSPDAERALREAMVVHEASTIPHPCDMCRRIAAALLRAEARGWREAQPHIPSRRARELESAAEEVERG